jgi:hypothetical protein
MILYKFVTAQRAINILNSGFVRFSQLAALNDPFESFPQAEGFVTREFAFKIFDIALSHKDILNNLIEETYQRMYNDLSPEQKELLDFQGYKIIAKKIVDAELAKRNTTLDDLLRTLLETNSETLLATMKQQVITSIANNICVLSLSTAKSNPLMWSHYADSHRGVAIGFNSQDPFFSKALRVQYRIERPKVDLFPIPEEEQEKLKLAEAILATKNISWHYEEEYRLLNATVLLQKNPANNPSGFPIFVATFPTLSLQHVIFGCSTPEDYKKRIIEIIVAKYPAATMSEAILDTQTFQINFKP